MQQRDVVGPTLEHGLHLRDGLGRAVELVGQRRGQLQAQVEQLLFTRLAAIVLRVGTLTSIMAVNFLLPGLVKFFVWIFDQNPARLMPFPRSLTARS